MASYLDLLSYKGKRAVVTGAASGMGKATVEYLATVDAEILALDIQPVADGPWTYVQVDLGDRASIDEAVAQIGGPVDALFNIAGHAGGRGKEIPAMLVNFVGHRHLTEKLLPVMPRGSAIVNVSSLAGVRYIVESVRQELLPLLETSTFEEADAWLHENPEKFNGYGTSKELQNIWTARMCKELAEQYGVRINTVAPGSTDTPLIEGFKANARERTGSDEGVTFARGFLGRFAHAEDQAAACVFINSDAASMITGVVLNVDGGMAGSMLGGTLPLPGPRGR